MTKQKQDNTIQSLVEDLENMLRDTESLVDQDPCDQADWAILLSYKLRSLSELADVKYFQASAEKARTDGVLVDLFVRRILSENLANQEAFLLEAVEDGEYGAVLEASIEDVIAVANEIVPHLKKLCT